MNAKLMALVAASGLMVGAAVHADNLAVYTFTGANASGGASAGAADSSLHGTAGPVGVTGLIAQSGGGINFQTDGYDVALNTGEYMSFKFTPTTAVSFSNISFSTDRETSGSPPSYVVRSSATGATDLYTHTTGLLTPVPHSQSLASVAQLQNVSSAVTFYIFGYGTGTTSSADLVLDDLILQGSVGVPEPAALGLLGLGVTALLRRRA